MDFEECRKKIEQDYYDDLEHRMSVAKVSSDIELTLSSGRFLYIEFDAEIKDYGTYSWENWEIDWNSIGAVDGNGDEIFDNSYGVSLITKEEQTEMFSKLEDYLYELNKKNQIQWEY